MPILSKEREFPIIDVDGEKLEPFPEKKEIPKGVEEVPKGAELKEPITHRGRVLVTSPQATPVSIVLPITAATFANPKNWHKGVTFAIRWLLTFVGRQLKKYPGQTVFKQ